MTRHDKRTCRSQLVQNGRKQRAWDWEIDDSLLDSPIADAQVDEQFWAEMELYDTRFSWGLLAAQRMEAIKASEQMEGIVLSGSGPSTSTGTSTSTSTGNSDSDSNSELSIVSSNRYLGLEED